MQSFPIFSHKNLSVHNTLWRVQAFSCRLQEEVSVVLHLNLLHTASHLCWEEAIDICPYLLSLFNPWFYKLLLDNSAGLQVYHWHQWWLFPSDTGKYNIFKGFRQGPFPPNQHTHTGSVTVLTLFPELLPDSHFLWKWRNISDITTCPTARKAYAINGAAAGWLWCVPLAISMTSRKVAGTGWKLPSKWFYWWYYCWRQRDKPSADFQPPAVEQAQEPAEALGRGTAWSATAVNGKYHCNTWCP